MTGWRSLLIELGIQISFFVVLETCVALLWRYNTLLLVIAAAICAVALARWHSRFDICLFLIIGVLGSLAEIVFVRCGGWKYANPTLFGVPIWFPLAFGTTGLIGGRLARTMTSIWDKARPARDEEG